MKKLIAMILCLLFVVALASCESTPSGGSVEGEGGGNLTESEYFPDEKKEGRNTFSMEKKSLDENEAVVTLKVGGTEVKLAGFEIVIKFDKKIEAEEVNETSDFGGLYANSADAGELKLVWAATENITAGADICDIALNLNDVKSAELKIEILSLGYLGEGEADGRAPVKNIDGCSQSLTLN